MAKVRFSPDELKSELQDTVEIMLQACEAFDRGHEAQAKVLAVSMRLLVHEGNGECLLRLLNLASRDSKYNKNNMQFHNTCPAVNPRNLLPHQGLLVMQVSPDGVKYVPPLDDYPPVIEKSRADFIEWWSEQVVLKDDTGNTFTREGLVKFMANKTGLAHVDTKVSEELYRLSKLNAFGVKAFKELRGKVVREDDPKNSPVPSAIRQIAHEMIRTLYDSVPECFPKPYLTLSLTERETLQKM